MNEIININGVDYAPVSKKPNKHHINSLSKILSKRSYMAKSEKDRILNELRKSEDIVVKPKSEIKNPKNSDKPQFKSLSASNIKGIDDEGHLLFNMGRYRVSEWTIKDAIDIQQWYRYGKNVTVKSLSKKFGFSENVINNILGSFESGVLNPWMDNWHSKQSNKKPPVQNNPQKRKEMGWY